MAAWVSLRLLPKLEYGHLHLTSFSRMRVDLAARYIYTAVILVCTIGHKYMCHLCMLVLSESVSKALTLRGGESAEGTARFLLLMDKFFDCANVKNYSAGVKSCKPFQLSYTSAKHERLKVRLTKTV